MKNSVHRNKPIQREFSSTPPDFYSVDPVFTASLSISSQSQLSGFSLVWRAALDRCFSSTRVLSSFLLFALALLPEALSFIRLWKNIRTW